MLDAVVEFEADTTVMLETVPQDNVIKTRKVWWTCALVFVCVCVCVCVCVPSICVRENLYLHFKKSEFVLFVCVHATGKAHHTQVREWMGGWSDQGL